MTRFTRCFCHISFAQLSSIVHKMSLSCAQLIRVLELRLVKRLAKIDEKAFMWVASHEYNQRGSRLPEFFKWVSKTADGHYYPVVLLAVFALEPDYGKVLLYTAIMAYALEIPIYLLMKNIFKRKRPSDFLQNFESYISPADKFSLPSGHTAAAFLIVTIIGLFYPIAFIPAVIWACLVGISRVVLRVHFPLDVLVGALLGISIALISYQVLI